MNSLTLRTTAPSVRVALVFWFLAYFLHGQPVVTGVPPANTIQLKVAAGQTVRKGPVLLSRFFRMGEIYGGAVARINGKNVATQNDVRSRWRDGSLKHAILSFQADLSSVTSQEVAFVPGTAATGDFVIPSGTALPDLLMTLTTSQGQRYEIRPVEIASAGYLTPWTSGPLAVQYIIEDRTPNLRFDVPFNGHKSFHPIFVATAFSGWPGLKIECIGENMWTNAEQDIRYSLTVSTGFAGQPLKQVFSVANFNHYARSRWRQTFWIGPAAPDFDIDHNLRYLIASGALPNFDTRIQMSPAAITDEVSKFGATDKGVMGGAGQWNRLMPTAGGRADIGLFPRWDVRYFYSFDRRLRDIMLANAGVSGHAPMHLRESALNGRQYHPQAIVQAYGRPVSIDARPTMFLMREDYRYADQVTPVGPATKGGWHVDMAHQPNFVYIAYLTTGDWYFLEELYFWAAHNTVWGNPGRSSFGSAAPWAILMDEVRSNAWGLRAIGEAAAMAPDNSPEKIYFTDKLFNNIAVQEGRFDMKNGSFYRPCTTTPYKMSTDQSVWCYGRNALEPNSGPNPLRFWKSHGAIPVSASVANVNTVLGMTSLWMENFIAPVLLHIEELGFREVAPLRIAFAYHAASQAVDPSWSPELMSSYQVPMLEKPTGRFFQTWASIFAAMAPSAVSAEIAAYNARAIDVEHGYPNIARAALAAAGNQVWGSVSGAEAWRRFDARYSAAGPNLSMNPKWAIVPRQ